jgi:lantibiotic biosynthesis protein
MAIQPFGFYVLRRHLVPVDGLFVLNETCDSLLKTEEFLRNLFSSAQMQESLYNASPDFYERFRCWLSGEEIAEKNRLIQTLFKYYLRICSRCTPYGMFAGCTTGEFDDETQIIFDETNPYRKFSRLDSNYIFEIVNFLLAEGEIRSQLKFFSNNTIYQIADKYHYLHYVIKEGRRAYSICSVDFSEYINQILEKAKTGCFIKDLINVLVSEDISEEEAHDFIEQLIDEQLLISEIEPTLTGEDFFSKLLQKLFSINVSQEILCSLQKIKDLLQNPNLQIAEYDQINILLKNLVSNSYQDIIQTDLFF